MKTETTLRKVQSRQGSLVVTIPRRMAQALGIKKNQYVSFVIDGDRLVIVPVGGMAASGDGQVDAGPDTGSASEVEPQRAESGRTGSRPSRAGRLEKLQM